MSYKPFFPVIGARRTITGESVPQTITGEIHTVSDMYIKLHEVPQFISGQQNVVIVGYTEVFTEPGPTNFRVNYSTGRVFFHASQEGARVYVSYTGLGSLTAVDEINWLWEQLTSQKTFLSLRDTPNAYDGYPRQYLRVTKEGNGLEFVHPTIGRAIANYIPLVLQPGVPVEVDGGAFDVVSFYEVIQQEDTGESSSPLVWDLSGASIERTELDSGLAWTLAAPAASAIGGMRLDAITDLDGWNAVTEMAVLGVEPENTKLRVALIIGGIPHVWDGFRFVGIPAQTDEELIAQGMSFSDFNNVPGIAYNYAVGREIGLWVAMQASPAAESPYWTGDLHVQGRRGGGFAVADYCEAVMDTQLSKWTFTSTAAEAKNTLIVLGSGRDEICCSSDVLTFEDVGVGEELTIGASAQTTLQLYALEDSPVDGIYTGEGFAQWSSTDAHNPLIDIVGHPLAVQQSESGKNAYSLYPNLKTLVTGRDGSIRDELDGYAISEYGTCLLDAGLTGPAIHIFSNSGIRIGASWIDFYNSASTHRKYVNVAIGGMFKWISGSPYIITPWVNMSYIADYGGWYQRVAARMYSDRVRIICGAWSKDVMIDPDEWASVTLYNMCTEFSPGAYDQKRVYYNVNGTIGSVLHYEAWGAGISDRLLAVPGAIGGTNSQHQFTGEFLCDGAYVSSDYTEQSAALTSMRTQIGSSRAALNTAEPGLKFKTSNAIDATDWPEIKRVLVTTTAANYGEQSRFFIEANGGGLLTYDAGTDTFHTYSAEQPFVSMYEYGMTAAELAAVPDWKIASVGIESFRLWQLIRPMPTDGIVAATSGAASNVGRLWTDFSIEKTNAQRVWRMLRPGVDYKARWVDKSKTWVVTPLGNEMKTYKAVASGMSAVEAVGGGGATMFTELLDGPDTLAYVEHTILTAQGGRVRTRPYVHHMMTGQV